MCQKSYQALIGVEMNEKTLCLPFRKEKIQREADSELGLGPPVSSIQINRVIKKFPKIDFTIHAVPRDW